jgi:sulfide:quinone oxidoreductase
MKPKRSRSIQSRTNLKARPRVVVLGGGFGGLEAALYMRAKMPVEADITLVSDKDYFLFKPNTIYVPFGLDPAKLTFHLSGPTRRRNISLVTATAREIDPISRRVCLDRPNQISDLPYDYLVVATGSGMRPEEIPGLSEFGTNIWTTNEMLALRAAFHKLLADAKEGLKRDVLFLVPPNNKCSGPLYEMVMMLDTWLRRKKVRNQVSITWSTFEESYIQAFGTRMHEIVTQEFAQRGISGHARYAVDSVERGEAVYKNGERLPFDLLVSFPPQGASTHFTHLPVDDRGFIATDLKTRQVVGYPDVYAVGDASDFPVKQADLAFLQADAAAEHLAAHLLGKESTFDFDPVSMCVREGSDRVTFAQVTLQVTGVPGVPGTPVEVPANAEGLYRVGPSPIWRLGKMALGLYLPWRFKAGNPFHSGVPWKGMEDEGRKRGLKVMSGVLAR